MNRKNVVFLSVLSCLLLLALLSHAQNKISERKEIPALEKAAVRERFPYFDSLIFEDIAYLSNDIKMTGFLITPKRKERYPCIVVNFGGNVIDHPFGYREAGALMGFIAKAGYSVIACNYLDAKNQGIFKDEYGGKDVDHVINLLNLLHSFPEIDTARIGMFGWSRGAMESFMCMTRTSQLKAVVVGGALSDFFQSIQDRPEMETEVAARFIPNYHKNKDAELAKRSVIRWVNKLPRKVPILVLHGTADWRVNPSQSLKLALALQEHKIPYRLIMYEGGDHSIAEHRTEKNAQTILWFDRFLKQGEKLPAVQPNKP